LLVVGDYHGNPGSLSFYDVGGNLFLSVYFSETNPDNVPQSELRYGSHEFSGTDSSLVFKQLNLHLFENTGRFIPQESLKVSKAAHKTALQPDSTQLPTPAKSVEKDFARRLNVFDDRLEFLSNDRIFLRLYIKSVKEDAAIV